MHKFDPCRPGLARTDAQEHSRSHPDSICRYHPTVTNSLNTTQASLFFLAKATKPLSLTRVHLHRILDVWTITKGLYSGLWWHDCERKQLTLRAWRHLAWVRGGQVGGLCEQSVHHQKSLTSHAGCRYQTHPMPGCHHWGSEDRDPKICR